MSSHRQDGTRVLVPEGHDLTKLCACCRRRTTEFDGKWAKCKRCNQDCTNVGCRTLPPDRRGIFGHFQRVARSRLFR